jgi:hypothetical protein
VDKRAELRRKALKDLQQSEVLMIDGHFDYGNGYHGARVPEPASAVPPSRRRSGASRRTCST